MNPSQPEKQPSPNDTLLLAQEGLQWLDPLWKDPNFQRFLEHMAIGVKANAKLALDVTKTPTERNDFAQRHFILSEFAAWPERQRNAWMAMIQNHREKPAKPSEF